ncbi:MAG: hypothetical protein K9J17_00110 [Flavobacteriales bacterium]|nr:hypothetical protein [Flavobacteriales bacterium]
MKSILSLSLAICFAVGASAQKLSLKKGSFKALSGEKNVNVVYVYDDMNVGTGKREMKETDYVAKKVAEYNEKEAGRGDSWAKAWVADREGRFQGKFEQLFNKGMSKLGLTIGTGRSDAKYTLIVHTTMTEPGFSVPMVMTIPSDINLKISLVETGSETALGEMELIGSPGNAFNGAAWDTGMRIQESYAKAGKEFAKWLPGKGMK